MAKIIIGIAGGIASGKSLAGKVANGLGFHAIETSDVIRSLLREEGEKAPDRDRCIQKAHQLVKEYGPGVLGMFAAQEAINSNKNQVAICGIRHPEQIKEITRYFHNAFFLFMDIDPKVQKQRAVQRFKETNPKHTAKELDLFSQRIEQQITDEGASEGNTSVHLPKTRQASHVSINNSVLSKEHFSAVVESLIQVPTQTLYR